MINLLYSILTSDYTISPTDVYSKRRGQLWVPPECSAIKNYLLAGVTDTDASLVASVICYEALQTRFGPEILELDSNNTYVKVTRAAGNNSDLLCVYQHTVTTEALGQIVQYLDKDIRERLAVTSWSDITAACCLQLLRMVHSWI